MAGGDDLTQGSYLGRAKIRTPITSLGDQFFVLPLVIPVDFAHMMIGIFIIYQEDLSPMLCCLMDPSGPQFPLMQDGRVGQDGL